MGRKGEGKRGKCREVRKEGGKGKGRKETEGEEREREDG